VGYLNIELLFSGIAHYIDGTTLYLSKGNNIYTCEMTSSHLKLVKVYELPITNMERVKSFSRLSRRLFRSGIHHITIFNEKLIVLAYGKKWAIDLDSKKLIQAPTPIEGSRPLNLCTTPMGLFYGEYKGNPGCQPIRLFHSPDGLSWAEYCCFSNIRHIHGVFYDEFTKTVWVTTGDEDDESAIWNNSIDNPNKFEAVIQGTQQSRAIQLQFLEDSVIYGTDTPLEKNYIYRMDRVTLVPSALKQVNGSVFHSTLFKNHLFFSTAVEPSKVNTDTNANIYWSTNGKNWAKLISHKKDLFPKKLFQYGQLIFPAGNNTTNYLIYSSFGVKRDHKIYRAYIYE
jgi:hypothetical protein